MIKFFPEIKKYALATAIVSIMSPMYSANAAPISPSSVDILEAPIFFLTLKVTDSQEGKMYFKLPCNRCPKSLELRNDVTITKGKTEIDPKSLFMRKDYQAKSILFDRRSKKIIQIELFEEN